METDDKRQKADTELQAVRDRSEGTANWCKCKREELAGTLIARMQVKVCLRQRGRDLPMTNNDRSYSPCLDIIFGAISFPLVSIHDSYRAGRVDSHLGKCCAAARGKEVIDQFVSGPFGLAPRPSRPHQRSPRRPPSGGHRAEPHPMPQDAAGSHCPSFECGSCLPLLSTRTWSCILIRANSTSAALAS